MNIPVYADQIAKWADELSKQFDLDFSTMVDSLNNFNWSSILSGATEFTTNFFSSLVNVTVNVASGIFTFVLSVIFSAYFLTSKESLLLSLKRVSYSLLPKKVVATLADIAVNLEQRVFFLCARPADGVCHFRLPVLHLHVAYRV